MFFHKDNEPAGQNVYTCTSVDTWTKQGTGGGVTSIEGFDIDPGTGAATATGNLFPEFDGSGYANGVKVGSGAPLSGDCDAAGEVGRIYARTDGSGANKTFYVCGNTGAGTYAWETPGSSGGQSIVKKCAVGTSTSSTTLATLGTVDLTGLQVGGMIRITARLTHDGGTAVIPQQVVTLGGTDIYTSSWSNATNTNDSLTQTIALTGAAEQMLTTVNYQGTTAPNLSGSSWSTQTVDLSSGNATLSIRGKMASTTTEAINLRHFCIEYLPAL